MAKSSVDQIGAMETFVLALISEGEVQTLYDLQRKARLSSGAALPALRRLEALKLIRAKSEKGSRKRSFLLTAEGRDVLRKGWPSFLQEIPSDVEGILRRAWIAALMGDRSFAAEYLHKAARRKQDAADREKRMNEENTAPGYIEFASTVAWRVLETEARALNDIAVQLEK
jgi:DNA-binding PadR family transcriptional regulator